ncbi:MAG: NADPH-dependent F420 reductase [Nitrososphaeraceae archaeon]|nr:NADPH-dependent F420 reductase [Nitrososphaeraceae archaeon]MBV9666773.1 NADPH-dependent F420 reductase [Nitrososphaeraceae archaeon]
MKIAILGAGNVGGTLGKAFASAGHKVFFGVPNPEDEKNKKLIDLIGPNSSSAGSVSDAVQFAELVVLATPWNAARTALQSAGNLSDKVVVDCTNPLKEDMSGLVIGHTSSAAEQIAQWAVGAKVCKAFNQTGFQNMANPKFNSGNAVIFVCGDDFSSKKIVLQLAEQIGFESIDAGPLSVARLLEPLAMLWIHLAYKANMGTDFAFGILRR